MLNSTLIISPEHFVLEAVYGFAFLLACLAAALLGRWTTKRLLIFTGVIVVLLTGIKAVLAVLREISGIGPVC